MIVVVAMMLLIGAPASASAHAVLESVSPPDESTTKTAVRQVELRFDETVSVAFGGVKAYGPTGKRVDSGAAKSSGHTVHIPVRASKTGTYAVSYRVVSADGHPVRGATTFHVRAKSADDRSEAAAQDASRSDRAVEIAFGVARGWALGALLLLAGGVVFVTLIAPGTRARLLGWMIAIAFVGVAVSFVLDAMNATGLTLTETLQGGVVRAESRTTWGTSALIQLGLLIVAAVWLRVIDLRNVRGRVRGVLICIPAVAPLLAWSLGGHAIATDPVWLRLPLDMLHMVLAAIWIGGLVQLIAYLRFDAVTIEHVERYSRWMTIIVAMLVATGLYAAYSEIGFVKAALADTTYGRLVVVKSLLLVAIAPLALLNQRRNVPGLRGNGGVQPNDARRRLRRYAWGEVALLVAVIAATAALIQTPPARVAVAAGLVDADISFPSGAHAQLVIDPARVGSNEIHVYAATKNDRIDPAVTAVSLRASGPHGIDNLKLPLLPSGPGHFTTPARTIPFAGTWTFELTVFRGKFETDTGSVRAKIGER
jgi:copper transport protein